MFIMVTEAQAATITALFGRSGWELMELQPDVIDSEITVNKATDVPML